jgi:hypothetical protein
MSTPRVAFDAPFPETDDILCEDYCQETPVKEGVGHPSLQGTPKLLMIHQLWLWKLDESKLNYQDMATKTTWSRDFCVACYVEVLTKG